MRLSSSDCLHRVQQRSSPQLPYAHLFFQKSALPSPRAKISNRTVTTTARGASANSQPSFAASVDITYIKKRHDACRCQAASSTQLMDTNSMTPQKWDKVTTRCVEFSTIVFIFLLMPQVVKNYISMANHNSEALAVLSWVGYLTSLFGNVLLLGCFVDKQEGGATAVQAIGATANFIMLGQIWLAQLMPSQAFVPLSVLMGSAAVVNTCKFTGALEHKGGQVIWRSWQDFLGVLGIAMLPQAIWAICSKHHTMLPATISSMVALAYLVLARQQRLSQALQSLWSDVPAWTATLLFMFQPIAQSVSNFSNPSTLEGLSTASILLGMLGNGLMVPRALFTGDKIWFIGVGWGPLTGWIQLMSMYIGRTVSGLRFLPGTWFAAITVVLVSATYITLSLNAAAKGLQSPAASVSSLFQERPQQQKSVEHTM